MKLRQTILFSLALGLTSLPTAFACEFHGGGNGYGYGAYNADWLAYYEERQSSQSDDEQQYSTMSDPIDEANTKAADESSVESARQASAKPSFSNTATRASNSAKARLTNNEAVDSATLVASKRPR